MNKRELVLSLLDEGEGSEFTVCLSSQEVKAVIVPRNQVMGHSSRTDERFRPAQGHLRSVARHPRVSPTLQRVTALTMSHFT